MRSFAKRYLEGVRSLADTANVFARPFLITILAASACNAQASGSYQFNGGGGESASDTKGEHSTEIDSESAQGEGEREEGDSRIRFDLSLGDVGESNLLTADIVVEQDICLFEEPGGAPAESVHSCLVANNTSGAPLGQPPIEGGFTHPGRYMGRFAISEVIPPGSIVHSCEVVFPKCAQHPHNIASNEVIEVTDVLNPQSIPLLFNYVSMDDIPINPVPWGSQTFGAAQELDCDPEADPACAPQPTGRIIVDLHDYCQEQLNGSASNILQLKLEDETPPGEVRSVAVGTQELWEDEAAHIRVTYELPAG